MNIANWFCFVVLAMMVLVPRNSKANPPVGFTFEIVGDVNAVDPPNKPIMRLLNDSASASITSFSISIGDTDFHFATIAQTYQEVAEIDSDGDLTFVPPNAGTARIDVIDYSFTGFGPNDRFRFQADLDRDAAPQDVALDFQEVLFGNDNGNPVANSVLSAEFSTGEQLNITMEENPDPVNEVPPFKYVFSVSTLLDPIGAIGELIALVMSLNLQHGISNSLDTKLDSALNALDDMNTNNDVAAVNSLVAFINAVEAQSGNLIAVEDAEALIAAAQQIIDVL